MRWKRVRDKLKLQNVAWDGRGSEITFYGTHAHGEDSELSYEWSLRTSAIILSCTWDGRRSEIELSYTWCFVLMQPNIIIKFCH